MSYSDCIIAIAYGGDEGSELALAWLRETETFTWLRLLLAGAK